MNRRQISATIVSFLALFALVNVVKAQSRDRDNPTRLTSNVISGIVNSEVRGNYYFYSFTANPGEVVITLTVEPAKGTIKDWENYARTTVGFKLSDRNATAVAEKEVISTIASGSGQAVARIEVTRRQSMVLSVHFTDSEMDKSVGGKYRIRIEGSVELGQDGSTSISKDKTDSSGCLPKQGTLIIRMKDGSKKIIDLSEAENITVVP